MPDFDIVIIGSGPGGYVAAIKAAQHGKKVAIVEKDALGGICGNWGCIPTKALLKSAEMFQALKHAAAYGLAADNVRADFAAVMKRSRGVADQSRHGTGFLMKKNKVTVIEGTARFTGPQQIEVALKVGGTQAVTAGAFIVATGHKPRSFPNLPIDGTRVITYRQALALEKQPKSLLCVGAGAIGMEFGYFFNALGTQVTVVEVLDQVLPLEDAEIAKVVEKSFTKASVAVRTATKVAKLEVKPLSVVAHLEKDGKTEPIEVETVLVAVGFVANTEGVGLEAAGVKLDERGFIAVDPDQRTNVPGIYAIGDVCGRQLLAHKASFEAEAAVGHLVGHAQPVDYAQIPGCTYCQPQVASIGLTEKQALANGRKIKIGRFPFMASGKARAIGNTEGMVKLIFDAEFDQLIGAHIVGVDATEMLAELGLALKLESTARELMHTVHAHPTLSEAVMEAAADALGQVVHL